MLAKTEKEKRLSSEHLIWGLIRSCSDQREKIFILSCRSTVIMAIIT